MLFQRYRVPALLAALTTLTFGACDDDTDVKPKPTAAFITQSGTCQSSGCTVTFSNASKNATSYSWDFGDNTTGTQADAQFTHLYAQAGVYRVRLRADGNGSSNETVQDVTVGATCTYSVVQVTSSITTPTTWESCKIYVVGTGVGVSSTLTVQPGAIVKFRPSAGLTLTAGGRIEAVGTAAQPVVFTSYKDDAHGGDTNGDGASAPARKDWAQIFLTGQSNSRFEHCKIMYGGSTGQAVTVFGVSATVKNSLIAHNGGNGSLKGALDAGNAAAGTVIQGNTFFDNEMPLRVVNLFSLDNSNSFRNPQNANEKNDYQGIWVEGATGPSPQLSWEETELPYVLGYTGWHAPVTVGAGVVLKFKAAADFQLNGNARLLARGTSAQPVVFTSYLDDTYGGDTNRDGAATAPGKKDWGSVLVNGTTGSEFAYCRFSYGGDGGTTLDLFGGSASVTNCTFAHNGQESTVQTRAALDGYNAAAGTVVQHNTFFDNIRPLSITSSFDLDDSNTFHNPANAAQKNTYQGIVVNWDVNKAKPNVTWGETELAYVNIYNVDLKKNTTLALGNNVGLKFNTGVSMIFRDSPAQLLNATGTGVYFTSVKDDSRGGDSNGNGAANAPAPGDWEGIYHDTLPGMWMAWSNMQFNRK